MASLNKQGFQLIEVVVALALFFVVAVGAALGATRAFDSLQRTEALQKRTEIVDETVAALEQVARRDWDALIVGEYGVASSSGYWTLAPDPDASHTGVTRTVSIAAVSRDTSCGIVEAGGDVDPDTKKVTVQLDKEVDGRVQQWVSEHVLTRWNAPTTCLSEGLVRYLDFDVTAASLDATKKSLVGVAAENIGDVDLTIETMTLTWTKPGNIQFIKIDGVNHWHATNGTGEPQGAQPSGTVIDIVDKQVLAGAGPIEFSAIRFDAKVDGSIFHITATLSDGSATTSEFFVP